MEKDMICIDGQHGVMCVDIEKMLGN